MHRFSVDVPITDLNGEWTTEAAAAWVGTRWPLKLSQLKLGDVELGDVAIPARVVAAEAAPDGVTVRLDLEIDIPLADDHTVANINVDGN
ncbi:hypothetical protein ABT039_22725 [Streptomyces lasiicapitis]|uniref:hypothetical protein n=1 Tax=Streptomyces lasiicapitis TaxID=1923961 RepID=UPI0033216EBA